MPKKKLVIPDKLIINTDLSWNAKMVLSHALSGVDYLESSFATFPEIAHDLGISEREVRSAVDQIIREGFVSVPDNTPFRATAFRAHIKLHFDLISNEDANGQRSMDLEAEMAYEPHVADENEPEPEPEETEADLKVAFWDWFKDILALTPDEEVRLKELTYDLLVRFELEDAANPEIEAAIAADAETGRFNIFDGSITVVKDEDGADFFDRHIEEERLPELEFPPEEAVESEEPSPFIMEHELDAFLKEGDEVDEMDEQPEPEPKPEPEEEVPAGEEHSEAPAETPSKLSEEAWTDWHTLTLLNRTTCRAKARHKGLGNYDVIIDWAPNDFEDEPKQYSGKKSRGQDMSAFLRQVAERESQ